VEPLFILRRRGLPTLLVTAPWRLPLALWRAVRRMRGADLIYINTMMVVDYLVAARFFAAKTVVHVHEIPDGAQVAVCRRPLAWPVCEPVFNSKATRAAYTLPASQPQHVVYNGIAAPADAATRDYDGTRPLRLLMLGRVNRIKG